MTDFAFITQDHIQARLSDALRLFVGRGRRYSLAALAAATPIPESTLKSYVEGRAVPGLTNFLILVSYLPPEFADMILAPTGKGNVVDFECKRGGIFAINHSAAELLHLISSALNDPHSPGRIDHCERAGFKPTLRQLNALINSVLAED